MSKGQRLANYSDRALGPSTWLETLSTRFQDVLSGTNLGGGQRPPPGVYCVCASRHAWELPERDSSHFQGPGSAVRGARLARRWHLDAYYRAMNLSRSVLVPMQRRPATELEKERGTEMEVDGHRCWRSLMSTP